jgi:hypothetical protein
VTPVVIAPMPRSSADWKLGAGFAVDFATASRASSLRFLRADFADRLRLRGPWAMGAP